RRHPHLATAIEPREQCVAAARIEVGGNLVEKQDRRRLATACNQLGMGEYEAEQERLLLAGRGPGRRLVLGAVTNRKILPMRPFDGPAGGGVAGAVGEKRIAEGGPIPA